MKFPRDHVAHSCALEWWYVFGRINETRSFHHSLFKVTVGREQRLFLHCSLDGQFREYTEYDLNKFSTGFDGTDFVLKNDFLDVTLHPCVSPVVHKDSDNWKYYSIPFLTGVTKDGARVDAWFDHEYGNLPDLNEIFRKKKDLFWDWTATKYNDGTFRVSATGKYDFLGENKSQMPNGEVVYQGQEVIFNPKFGPRYSEQPFAVMDGEKQIGYGIRERTYKRGE